MSGRILVVDDIATNRLILKAKLSKAYYDVLEASSGLEAIEVAFASQPDMILLDVMMPEVDGYDVCTILKSDPQTAHIPIVMVTAANKSAERLRGLQSGADDFLNKPINDTELFARVRNLLRVKLMFDELKIREATTKELGLGDIIKDSDDAYDEPANVMLAPISCKQKNKWRNDIESHLQVKLSCAEGEEKCEALAMETQPDAIIVNQSIANNGDGLRLVSRLRTKIQTRQSAIIFVVEDGSIDTAAKALELGASDYIHAPYDENELRVRLRSQLRRKRYSDKLRSNVADSIRMAVIDPLTGLYNRRYATQHMQKIITRSKETDLPFTVMMMDIDHFKSVNDTYGHPAGDTVLKEVARRLQENLRGVDLTARIGGEEFLVIMPDTLPHEAEIAAERLRRIIGEQPFELNATSIYATVSIGVSIGTSDTQHIDTLIEQADKALYQSKTSGRNRVSFSADAA